MNPLTYNSNSNSHQFAQYLTERQSTEESLGEPSSYFQRNYLDHATKTSIEEGAGEYGQHQISQEEENTKLIEI